MFPQFRPAITIAFLLTFFLMASCSSENGDDGKEESATIDMITAPVGQVDVAETGIAETAGSEPAQATPAASGGKGKEIYDGVCFACHAQGLAGAPMLGDKEAWEARLEPGHETLYDHAINGFTGPGGSIMPAKGGRADIADDDIKAAVDYMIEAVGGSVVAAAESSTATEAPAVEEISAVAEETTASEPAATGKGKEVYDSACSACHAMGIAGAPKLADKEAWSARIAQGNDLLYDHAINGFMGVGLMPPKGGRADLSDDDVKAAVDYMVENSQ